MKRFIMRKIFNIALVCSILAAVSCSDTVNDSSAENAPSQMEQSATNEKGSTTVRMFVPDYYALAEQGATRAIAPQSVKARLCYLVNGSWIGINTVTLSEAEKTPVENAPDGFSGSVYTLSFDGVPIGIYVAGNLKIELMDASDVAITSGTNATAVTIAKGGSASTTFYTLPESTGANSGNLAPGEMKFSRAALVKGVTYNLVLTSSGDYPDLVLFGSNGKLVKYHAVDSETEGNISLTVDETDVYYLGVWADDGNDIARYALSFDYDEGTKLDKGVLTGTNLHWTKENSPYIVNANLLVEEGAELTVDPGVIVQFTGNYYIKVNGTISAVGTKSEPIIFVQSGDNLSNWAGISIDSTTGLNVVDTYTYVSGNRLKNCMVIGASTPLTLNSAAYVDSCTFTGNSSRINVRSDSLLINNVIDNGVYAESSSKIINNKIKTYIAVDSYSTFVNNTITNAVICLGYYYGDYGEWESNYAGLFSANTINSCSVGISHSLDTSARITGNNFIGYSGTILNVSNCSYKDRKSFNFTGNYWGEEQTAEIESKCGASVPAAEKDYNMSFFNDYYDNFENTKIDFSNWATAPIEGAGYLGDGFIAFDYTINGYNYENGGYYPESTSPDLSIAVNPKYHANDIASIRIAQSLESLKGKDWSAYSASQSFTVDTTELVDGAATIYVQIKDSEGNVSSPVMHEVPFDKPAVTLSIADGTTYTSATSSVSLNFGATDKGNLTQYVLYLDGVRVKFEETSSGWGKSESWSYSLGLAYMPSGNHTLKLTFWDSARNSTTKEIAFTINRNVDTTSFAGTTFDATSGQLLKDTNTVYLWHLDSDGSEADGDGSASLFGYTAGTGGLGGYAEYANTSDYISLQLENAYTVEFWRKGSNDFRIEKSEVFEFYSTYGYYQYTSASDTANSGYLDWLLPADGKWHFWSFVFGEKYTAVYCDGTLMRCNPAISQKPASNDNKLYLDARNIDELRISRTARSADEIAAYYAVAKNLIQ